MESTLGFRFLGREAVRFERTFDVPAERVWAAVSTPDGLNAWFLPIVDIEPRPGGRYTIPTTNFPLAGTITEFAPPSVIALGDMRFEIVPQDAGCRLEFTLTRSSIGWVPGVLAGYHAMLDGLRAYIEGMPQNEVARASGGWRRYYRVYERAVGDALAGGARVVYRVHFDEGAAHVLPDAAAVLHELIALLARRPELAVVVDAHADDRLDEAGGLELSRRRAQSVAGTLIGAGVARERIVQRHFGETYRLRRSDDAESRAFNRRVELVPTF